MLMAWYWAAALMLGMVVGLMLIGAPVAIAFMIANLVGVVIFMGGLRGIEQLVANASDGVANFLLVAVPLFILMGNLFFYSDIGKRVFDTLDKLFGQLPGRLCYVTVAGGTIFASLSGSAMANTAMMGSLMTPEMTRRGYKKHMAIGPAVGAGGLAILIPPSALAVLLGSLAKIDIGALLIAGVVPGLVLAVLYVGTIFLQTWLDPAAAPTYAVAAVSAREKMRLAVVNILPMGLIVFCVIGLILLGFATPTEAAAFGVLGTLVLMVLYGRFDRGLIVKSLRETLRVTAMVFFIILASKTFSAVFAFSGATGGMVRWVTSFNFGTVELVLMMFLVLLFLGCFVDTVSMLLLTLPIFMPLAQASGIDLIWLGVIILLSLELSNLTPPFGLGLFVMMGVVEKGTTYRDVVLGAAPYLTCNLILFGLLLAFPALALYLPSLIATN